MPQILNNTRPMHVLRAYRSLHQVPAYAQNPQHLQGILMVGATGIEPVTSAVSRQKRDPLLLGLSPQSRS
jgi:hypothetical protein